MENFSVWPATEVRPANHAGRTSQFRGPHYNANFWTLDGPQFMTSRAAFGPRAALVTPLLYGINTRLNRVRLEELVGDIGRWKDILHAASMACPDGSTGRAYRMIN